ncbi:MAG TPA: acyltransferase, partial [Actinomycetota bacterium]
MNGYADYGSWTYQDVREVSLSTPAETVFAIFVTVGSLFLMGLFFLVAGLLAEDSLARKHRGRFVRDRLIRLGVPFAVFTLVLWPLVELVMFESTGYDQTYWFWFSPDPYLDNGPVWFVGVLLVFSLLYAALPRPARDEPRTALGARHLVVLAAVVGASSFLVRLVFPIGSEQFLNPHFFQWSQLGWAFALGAVAARRGWLRPVPDRLARGCAIATLFATLTIAAIVVSAEPLGYEPDIFYGGWALAPLLAATFEGILAVTAPIWLLHVAQHRLDRAGPILADLARSSYAAYLLQAPVLVGLALLLRPVALAGDAKALAVGVLGVVASFGL